MSVTVERDLAAVAQNLQTLANLRLDVFVVRERTPQGLGSLVNFAQRKFVSERTH